MADRQIEALARDLADRDRMIWLLVEAAGGTVRIPRELLERFDHTKMRVRAGEEVLGDLMLEAFVYPPYTRPRREWP